MKSLMVLLSMLLCSACATHGEKRNPEVSLTGQKWVLVDGLGISLPEDSRPNLTFSPDGRITGFSGCNRFFGGYTVSGSQLSFSPIGSTKMACLGEGGEIEKRFLSSLSDVRSYRLEPGGRLNLQTEKGPELILTSK